MTVRAVRSARLDGSFSFEPYVDSDGDDSFTYRVGDGLAWSTLRSDGSFTYTPDAGYSGGDGFSYLVSDSQPGGVASAEITVDPSDPP